LKDGRQKTSNANLKDDIQKVSNASFDATNHSFERVTKATQAIVSEITDYSKRSFENGTKTMENLLGVRSLDKAFEVQRIRQDGVRGLCQPREQAGTALHQFGKRSLPAIRRLTAKVTQAKKSQGQLLRCPLLRLGPVCAFFRFPF
jgi:hypothetical protein